MVVSVVGWAELHLTAMQTPGPRGPASPHLSDQAPRRTPGPPRPPAPTSARWWCSLRIIAFIYIYWLLSCFCILVLWWRPSSSVFEKCLCSSEPQQLSQMSLLFIFFIVFLSLLGEGGALMSAVAGKMKNLKRKKCVKSRILYSYVNNSFLLITVYIWFINLIIKSLKTSFLFIYMYVFRIEGFW